MPEKLTAVMPAPIIDNINNVYITEFMIYRKLLLFIAGVLITGCYKEKPNKVVVIDFDSLSGEYGNSPIEKLNGNVREVYIGDSLSKNDYIRIHFDENGKMKSCFKRVWHVIEFDNRVDSTVEELRVNYEYRYKSNKISVTARYADGGRMIVDLDNLWRVVNGNCGYDKYGNLVQLNSFHKGVEPDIFYYKYDDHGRLVELGLTEGVLLLKSTFSYIELDSHNNWIKKTVKKERYIPEGVPPETDTTIRKITYY